jgi:hypothetical protein
MRRSPGLSDYGRIVRHSIDRPPTNHGGVINAAGRAARRRDEGTQQWFSTMPVPSPKLIPFPGSMTPFDARTDRELIERMWRNEREVRRAIIRSRNEIEDTRRLLDDIELSPESRAHNTLNKSPL